jgi:DNA-binding NarL/FixJ family response regulator
MCMKIEILLADDQFLILEGIKAILEPEPKIKVVGTAQDGQTAIAMVRELRPDILLIDIEMPKMNGILATKYICKYLPNTKVIVLTSHKNQDYIAEALLAGASGYLWKGNLIRDLKQEIYSFGKGYSGVKAKLLTQTAKKNSLTNVVEYREKIIYFKKYRKNIYKPAVNQKKQQRLRKTSNIRLVTETLPWNDEASSDFVNPGIAKAALDPTFKPLAAKEIKTANQKTFSPSRVCSPFRFNRRKYLKKIIWLLLVISSIVLSIVIF